MDEPSTKRTARIPPVPESSFQERSPAISVLTTCTGTHYDLRRSAGRYFVIEDDLLSCKFARLMPEPLSDREAEVCSCPNLEVLDPIGVERAWLDLSASLQEQL